MVLLTPASHMDQAGSSHTSVANGHDDIEGGGSYSAMGKDFHSWMSDGKRCSRPQQRDEGVAVREEVHGRNKGRLQLHNITGGKRKLGNRARQGGQQ